MNTFINSLSPITQALGTVGLAAFIFSIIYWFSDRKKEYAAVSNVDENNSYAEKPMKTIIHKKNINIGNYRHMEHSEMIIPLEAMESEWTPTEKL